MANVVVVEVVEGVEGLAHDGGCLCLCQVLALCDVEEELSSLTESVESIKNHVKQNQGQTKNGKKD